MRQKILKLWQFLFGDSARAFGTLSVILLICLAIAPAKDRFREWTRYQQKYLRLIRGRGEAATLQRRFQGGLQQIWMPELGVTDRCGTCHLGLKEASLWDVSTQPFRPHPPIPHSLTEFGCVMCHRGQGAATGVEEAHRSTLAWEQPILPARYMEASCGQCHWNTLTGTPQLSQGRQLLTRYGCVACHVLKTPEGNRLASTVDAPPLTHIAEKTTREWTFAWLKNPQAYAITATMPNFQFSDADARDITAFLMVGQASGLSTQSAVQSAAQSSDAATGASVYGESFCASCHATVNAAGMLVGGDVGPELTRIGSKVKPEWLADWLHNPQTYDPATAMPHYRFDQKLLGPLRAFLEAKTDSDFLANVHLEPATPEQVAHGKALAKIRQPHAFPSAKMPQYTFTQLQVDALVTALLAQTERARTLPASLRVAGKRESNYRPAGKAGQLMADMNCFSCHAIDGRGGTMAPDLTWEGSSVQRRWLVSFMKNPNTLRPALIRRMPRFNVTDAEAETIADYILTVYQTPDFDRDALDPAKFTAADIELGKQLFYSKYACQSCHIVDPQNDKGYVGPTLTQVGARLNAAWIFHWLKDPQALRPGTIEPNRNMSDADARALTAFLMKQNKEVARK